MAAKSELILALEQIEREKGIRKDDILKMIEGDKLYDEFKPKEGEIVAGSVHRFMDRNIVVDLGKTEAILPMREQIRRERYSVGGSVRAVILRVDKAQRGPQVLISRAAPLF